MSSVLPRPDPIPFDDGLLDRMRHNLADHDRRTLSLDGRRHAAVAIVLGDSDVGEDRVDPAPWEAGAMDVVPGDASGLDGRMENVSGGASFLLCRRSGGLRSHAAQWALPGGRLDPGEDVIEAALRETHEEVGIELGRDSVVGVLDDYPTRSGYVITPVVVWGGGRVDLAPSPDEVLAVYRIGLHNLLAPDSPRFVDIPESDRPVVQVPLGNDLIHAPTGAVLVQFRWLALEGDPSPVDRFEQPVFAWR